MARQAADEAGVIESLATPLALIEFFGTLAIVVLLAVGLTARRRRLTPVVVVAVVFGIVFQNPLGLVGERSEMDQRPLTPSAQADRAMHWVKVAGIPVAWFTPYNQERPFAFAFENSPNSDLKLRYGFSFLPSTGASTVVPQCSDSIHDPCWRGRSDDSPLVNHDRSGQTWVVPLTQTNLYDTQGGEGRTNVQQFYEVRLGLASPRALLYWLALALIVGLTARQARIRWSAVGVAAAVTLVAGIAVTGVIAAVPQPARSASSQTPELLPEPAEAPAPEGRVEPTPLEQYAEGCIARVGGANRNLCGRIGLLTAVETDTGILAAWTAESDGRMHLRIRGLTLAGQPVGSGSALLTSWDQVSPSGTSSNCEVPTKLQGARLPHDEVLVAWSDSCGAGTAEPASITGVVVERDGSLVRGPFVVARFARILTGLPPSFWLRSTSGGAALLLWDGTSGGSHGLFVSRLNDRQRAESATVLLTQEHGLGSVAVACGTSCLVAHGFEGTIALWSLSSDGSVERGGSIREGAAALHSDLTAAATGDRFAVGWLESDGTNADARLATLRAGEAPVVATVAEDVPHGSGSTASLLAPLGIAIRRDAPAVVWQTSTGSRSEPELRLYTSASTGTTANASDVAFWDGTVTGAGVLVAIASRWPDVPPEPVSIVVP